MFHFNKAEYNYAWWLAVALTAEQWVKKLNVKAF